MTDSPESTKRQLPATQDVEAILRKDAYAPKELQNLVSKGCNREAILVFLSLLPNPPVKDTWEEALGFDDPKKAHRLAERIRKCAREVGSLESDYFRILVVELLQTSIPHLASTLCSVADLLQAVRKSAGPKKHPLRNAVICLLVSYVKETTGRYYDKEVSALLSAVLDNDVYDKSRHGRWRREHCPRRQAN